jgi:phage terminase small subunit
MTTKPAAIRRKTTKRKTQTDQPEPIGDDGLTNKQRVFVEKYLTCWNATESAKQAGYSAKSAYSIGSENLRKPEIRQAVDQRLTEFQMGADEVLARLSALATADMGDFLSVSGRGVKLDLKRALAQGKLHVVRKYTKTDKGTSIELYDAKDALVQLGRHYGLFTDNISGEIETLTPEQLEQRRKERWEKAAPLLATVLANQTQREAGHE